MISNEGLKELSEDLESGPTVRELAGELLRWRVGLNLHPRATLGEPMSKPGDISIPKLIGYMQNAGIESIAREGGAIVFTPVGFKSGD